MKAGRPLKSAKVEFTCFTSGGHAFIETATSVSHAEAGARGFLEEGETVIAVVRTDCVATPKPGTPFTIFTYRGVLARLPESDAL